MKNNIFVFITIFTIATSCSQYKESASTAEEASVLETVKESQLTPTQLAEVVQHDLYSSGQTNIIKTVNYRFEVDNVRKSTEAIEVAIKKYQAYISSSKLHLENPVLENRMTIRVQNEYFQDLLKEIDLQARFVNFRNVSTEDVSKDFVDLESRLKTKREVEARYMEILRKQAGSVEELFEAERKIGMLHEEIEATISRINFLRDQVRFSTINLELYQTVTQELKAGDEITTQDKFADALKTGWQGVVTIFVALTYLWPLIFIGAGALIWLRWKNLRSKSVKSV